MEKLTTNTNTKQQEGKNGNGTRQKEKGNEKGNESKMETEEEKSTCKQRREKRGRRELDSSWEEKEMSEYVVEVDLIVKEARNIEEDIRTFLQNDPSRKMSTERVNQAMKMIGALSKAVMDTAVKNAYLAGAIEGMRRERYNVHEKLDKILDRVNTDKGKTFAQVTVSTPTRVPTLSGPTKRTPPQPAQVVVIKPPESRKEEKSDETKKIVMDLIKPGKDKMKIRGVRLRKDGGLVVEAATSADLEKIVGNEALKEKGYIVARTGSLNPRLVIFDVPNTIKEEELAENIWEQNEDLLVNLDAGEFLANFKPRFKMGRRREDLTNWVIEVSPKIRTLLRKEEKTRLYIEWQSCRIQDFRGVTRCFKCQQYGHVQKFCKDEEKTCAYCAKTGHMADECADKKAGKQPTCPACRKARKKSDHAGSDKKCPAFKSALDRIIQKTDYGA